MKKVVLTALLFIFNFSLILAQEGDLAKDKVAGKVSDAFSQKDLKGDFEEGWNKTSQFGVNFNASGFNDGWRTVNSGVVGNSMLNFVLNHQNALLSGKNLWVNDFQGNIGFMKPQGGEFNRNVDKLFINSMYGRKISDIISVFGEGNFISQFLQVKDKAEMGSRNVKSGFLNPGYLTISTGIEYRPKDYLSVKLAPLAQRWTFVTNNDIVRDQNGYAYGVNVGAGNKTLGEFGSQLTVGFNKEIVQNVNLGFRYNAFQGWQKFTDASNVSVPKNLKSTDHRLDLVATALINKYLNVNFTLIGIKDDDAVKDLQLATGFGVGFLANF